jgi:hypothetical protein
MAAREEAGEGESQRVTLADHDPVELRQHAGKALGNRDIGLAQRAYGHGSFSVALVP